MKTPTSTTGSSEDPAGALRSPFTLIELAAVAAIMAMAVGMAAIAMRDGSGRARFDRTALEFRRFCSGARAQAMELGRDRAVSCLPEQRAFVSGDPRPAPPLPEDSALVLTEPLPEEDGGDDPGSADYVAPPDLPRLTWTVPERFEMRRIGAGGEDEPIWSDDADGDGDAPPETELFRFLPDGGAAGDLNFALISGSRRRIFRISPISGRILEEEEGDSVR